MSRSSIAILSLVMLLALSNGMWAYALSSSAQPEQTHEFTCASDEHRLEVLERIAHPLESAIAASAAPGATKQSVVAAASDASTPLSNRFCIGDQDVVTVDLVGLRFNENGKLIGASSKICIQ
jgi:hypothetical protein